MLDNCSRGCFVKASLMKTLQIRGQKTSITVKTLTGEDNYTTFALEGLRVCSQLGLNQEWISLPKTYTKEDLLVGSWEVATAQKLKKWKHLSCVADEVIKDDQNVNVELLIGANCARALEPIKVIPSRNDGPYAMKIVLGWCIVGPISYRNQSKGKISCNQTAVMEAGSNKVSRHYFVVENKLKPDDDVKSTLKKIYQQEFTEPNMRFTSVIPETAGDVSYDDQILLRLMDQETVQVDNRYEVPLPLKSTDVTFPNNKSAAMKRLNSLKRRFIRDKLFHEMYKVFIDDMLQKGHARKVENEQVGKVWYIPHHGETHPAKPGKVGVVFDCSAESGGISLNKQLIAGPDLSNQLVGVLTRSREEHIVYMADIEAMFHQVRVPENQRSLLIRFLW